MDALGLDRAFLLLRYARKEQEAARRAAAGKGSEEEEASASAEDWPGVTEAVAETQVQGLKNFLSKYERSPLGVAGAIPERFREAIRWAEAEREKRRMN